MIRRNPLLGSVHRDGLIFTGRKGERKRKITPEKCIQAQFRMGSDLMVCLDYCTHPDDPDALQKESVELTIQWAKQCRLEFDRQWEQRGGREEIRPKLFGVIQGGTNRDLRERCASELLEIGFDGYAFGGWPLDSHGNLLTDTLEHTAQLMPADLPRYGLGIGKPDTLLACARMGYNLFDCVIPTRDARHGRLFIYSAKDQDNIDLFREPFFETVYPERETFVRDDRPVSAACDCPTCARYSLAYLHHLFTIHDALAFRLATIHNLRFYSILMEKIRGGL
jgi:queuine tRNA-ribosyltransferase